MKILSFAVPCYNSEAYMRKCIDSLLPGGEDVEIIIVDDGSSDGTAAIADEYEAKYPGICRAIHQENAGHGGAVNTGITNARGMYFKVVDSDDWLDTDSYKIVLNRLKQFREDRKRVDMFICNYVYEHVEDGTSHTIGYHKVLPEEKIFGWDEARHFRMDQNLCDLQNQSAERERAETAEAYILCGQSVCLYTVAVCEDVVLFRCGSLQIFYWT